MATPFYLTPNDPSEAYQPNFFERVDRGIKSVPAEGWFSLASALAGNKNIAKGLSQGLMGLTQATNEQKRKASLAEAMKGAMGGLSPEQAAFLQSMEPEQAANIVGSQLFAKPSEKWEVVDTDGDGRPDRQRSSLTGRIDDIPLSLADRQKLAEAGASRVTMNNLPPEIGARTAMGEGFTSDFESIKERVKKFYSGGPGGQVVRRGQMMFNTGEGGKLWADVETGKEALVRTLTGAGMAQAEAENQASRYGLSPYDTEFDALQKIERLKRDLENVAKGAYGARGRTYTPPEGGNYSDVDAILGLQ